MCSLFACVDARRCSGVRGQENRRRQHQNQLSPAVLCDRITEPTVEVGDGGAGDMWLL